MDLFKIIVGWCPKNCWEFGIGIGDDELSILRHSPRGKVNAEGAGRGEANAKGTGRGVEKSEFKKN